MAEGVEHHLARRFAKAVARYSRVVEMLPECGEAWRLLGVVALQTGDNQAARSLLERAIRIDANDAAAYSALGNVNESEGKLEAAYAAHAAACAIDATQEAAAVGLTRVALGLGRAAEAIAIGEAAVAHGTSDAGLLRTLGAARLKIRDFAGAAEALLASLRIKPHADAYANLGGAYVHLHRVDAAIVACDDALALDPLHAEAVNNLGIARKAEAAFTAALAAFERAVELGSEEAHVNLGTTRLLLGDYHGGWPHYGWVSPERRANPAFASLPMWDGRPSPGQRLLIWPEQGIGDTIQMARFLRRARALVGTITLACPPGTVDLLRTVEAVDELIDTREHPPLDAFDVWLPTIRLPVVFDIAHQSIPAAPYLRADPERIEHFRPRLNARGLRVGLVWSGNPEFAWNELRSCGLAELEPLHEVPGVTWFALQQGAARAQQARNGLQLVPINAEVSDFADTAAIISELDLVITVDTSVAHLAGALGRPAWVLLSNRPDWRWQLAGEVSPWYPTLRLFRQRHDGAWAPVVAAIAARLRDFAIGAERRTPD
jgi:tetratricopeptide (TPR) repeat protein